MKKIIILAVLLLINFTKIEKLRMENCYVKSSEEEITQIFNFVGTLISKFKYSGDSKYLIIYTKGKIEYGLGLLESGDKIFRVDNCLIYEEDGEDSSFRSIMYRLKKMTKSELFISSFKYKDLEGRVKKVYLIRNGIEIILNLEDYK